MACTRQVLNYNIAEAQFMPAIRIFAVAGALAYAGVVLLIYALQRSLIYLPRRMLLKEARREAAAVNFRPWGKGGLFLGWKREVGNAKGNILLLQGNNGHALEKAKGIWSSPQWNFYILEYPGYGIQTGKPSRKSILKLAEEGIGALDQSLPLVLIGVSLGSGFVSELCLSHAEVSGVVLLTPFLRLADTAKQRFPWAPTGLLLRDRLDNTHLARFRGPKLIVAGEKDILMPLAKTHVLSALTGSELEIVLGAGHALPPEGAWVARAKRFLEEVLQRQAAAVRH